MKKTKLFSIPFLLLFLPFFASAQDIHFSQLSETPLLLNPALAGMSHDLLVTTNFKSQWKSVTSTPYNTINVSADMAFLKKQNGSRLGVGLNMFSDKAGAGQMQTTTGQLHVAGILAVDPKNLISVGLYGGFGQTSLNYGNLIWDRQYDGMTYDASRPTYEPNTFSNHTYGDVGAGVDWFYGADHRVKSTDDALSFNAGFSVQHINKPIYSYYGEDEHLPMKFVAHGNAEIGLKKHGLILEPSYIVMLQQGAHEINAGMLVKYLFEDPATYSGPKKESAFFFGGYYRFSDAIVIATGYEYSNYRIGLSYDVNLSDLKTVSNARGGFEISLRFIAPSFFARDAPAIKSFD